jgi:hypothetical protein
MKRLGASPRAGRIGLPKDIPQKAVNVDCSKYFASKNPEQSVFTGTFNHSWQVGDETFALDLALTLEGEMDRLVIPTREKVDDQLILIAGKSRPEYQDEWDDDHPPKP